MGRGPRIKITDDPAQMKKNEYQRNWAKANPDKHGAISARFRANNPDKVLDYAAKHRWNKLGYPEPTRPRPEECEACGRPNGKQRLHLDHDHMTGEFRGWLCNTCNLTAGRFNDSPAMLRGLADYLEGKP